MSKEIKRSFIVGEDWLYFKIYTGPKTSEKILIEIIKPVAISLVDDGLIDKWFFIRFADPNYHLRIRFHLKKAEDIGLIISRLKPYFREFINQKLITELSINTYQREIERYGAETIEQVETLFFHESNLITDIIPALENFDGEETRWLFSLKMIDSILNAFKYNDYNKQLFLSQISSSFRKEFDISSALGKQLNNKFRLNKQKIEMFMKISAKDSQYDFIFQALENWEKNSNDIIKAILEENTNSQQDLNNLLSSLIHMFMNRLFKSKNRKIEMVCYDFLCRIYKSRNARKLQIIKKT